MDLIFQDTNHFDEDPSPKVYCHRGAIIMRPSLSSSELLLIRVRERSVAEHIARMSVENFEEAVQFTTVFDVDNSYDANLRMNPSLL